MKRRSKGCHNMFEVTDMPEAGKELGRGRKAKPKDRGGRSPGEEVWGEDFLLIRRVLHKAKAALNFGGHWKRK